MHQINVITEEFVKETRTDGTVTSLTIKLVAYDGDNNFTTITGDNSYLTGNDSTWQWKTVTDTTYHDYDNCTALASQTMTYTVPGADQTSLTQSFADHNVSEQLEYQAKRKAWESSYRDLEDYNNAWAAIYTTVKAL